jgi:type I restriction enzyme, S subunit
MNSINNKNNLPTGWKLVEIKDISFVNPRPDRIKIKDDLKVSFVPMSAVSANSGFIDVTQERPFSDVKKGYTSFLEGDVLFAKITPCMENGKIAVVPKLYNDYGFGSTEFHVLRPKQGIDARFLYYFISSENFRRNAAHHMTGAVGQKRVPADYIKKSIIPIAPSNEQKMIIAEIEKQFSRLDEAVENLKRIKSNLKRYKASVLKAAVEGKLTEEWRKANPDAEPADKLLDRILLERKKKWEEAELAKMKEKGKSPKDNNWHKKYKEPHTPEPEGLPKIPSSWVWATYDQLGEWNGGGTPSKQKSSYWEKGIIPWVSPKDMKTDRITKTIDKITQKAVKETVTKIIPSKSLLFVVRSGILRRMLPIAMNEMDVTINQDLKALTFSNLINDGYLLLISQALRDEILHSCQKNGTTVESIEFSRLLIFPIPMPPKAEQEVMEQVISSKITVVDKIYNEVEQEMIKADSLRQTILKKPSLDN